MTDRRSDEAKQYRKHYNSTRWKRLREYQLQTEPLCKFCLEQEIVEVATVADHIYPHKGDVRLFFDHTNLQSLCKAHHDGDKQRIEHGQSIVSFGADGWPTD